MDTTLDLIIVRRSLVRLQALACGARTRPANFNVAPFRCVSVRAT